MTLAGRMSRRWHLGLLAVAALVAGLLAQWSPVSWLDANIHDQLTRWAPARPAPDDIILVDIDERSLEEIGPWPWPRPVVARIVENLRQRGARLQVWDTFFSEPASGDDVLAAALQAGGAARDVVVGQVLVIDPLVQHPPRQGRLLPADRPLGLCATHPPVTGYFGLASTLGTPRGGHISSTPDPDGRSRRVPAVICADQREYPQLALAAAGALIPDIDWAVQSAGNPLGPARWLQRGRLRFPLDGDGNLVIPYLRPHTAWPAIGAARLFDPQAQLPSLQGRVVLIGATALGLGDTVSTPHHPNAPGVSVHAELLGAALDDAWPTWPRTPALVAALLSLGMAALLLPLPRPQRKSTWLALGMALMLSVPLLVAVLGRLGGYLLPVAAPSLALMCCGVGLFMGQVEQERRRAQRLAAHLESFLPHGLARDIARQNPSGDSLGRLCHGALLAVRVVGLERWTGVVDSLQALATVHAVSTLAEQVASRHGGALEHVQGETLLLAWPGPSADPVRAALEVARELQQQLHPLLECNETPRFPLSVRAALESGIFLLGVAGSRASRRPVLLGPVADDVLAMLSLCDELASPMLVGPAAAEAIQGQSSAELLHPIGQFLLPDQARPRQLYRVNL